MGPLLWRVMITTSCFLSGVVSQLQFGFYAPACPDAEQVVRSVVAGATRVNQRVPALLLRLHFHDCFVEGCDGSILLGNPSDSERSAFGNQGVEGFDVIQEAKSQLESICPGVVSCADIVALAARDAIALSQGPNYEVPTGRRDGRISETDRAANLPDVEEPIQVLKAKFIAKGLTAKDLVLLTAAHSIGTTACFFMQRRLYNFDDINGASDPAIDPTFLQTLMSKCPPQSNSQRIPLDPTTPLLFDDELLRNIKRGVAVIQSDARLNDDDETRQILDSYVLIPQASSFAADFVDSILKMGALQVKTGQEGEIRRVCGAVN
uniref:Peroxidase n=1 Tax=Kalanchoe fedtschenkoi TaxID=63787 RepID=A0A7N0TPG3_KALFE